jgi:hypothetical protein
MLVATGPSVIPTAFRAESARPLAGGSVHPLLLVVEVSPRGGSSTRKHATRNGDTSQRSVVRALPPEIEGT